MTFSATFGRFAVVGASVIVSVAIGVATAGMASASNTTSNLCVPDGIAVGSVAQEACAYAQGPKAVRMLPVPPTTSITNWYYPTGGYAQIRQAGTGLCLQLDHDAGNTVIEAACVTTASKPSYQEWEPIPMSVEEGSVFVYDFRSGWEATSADLCLSYDEAAPGKGTTSQHGTLDVTKCSSVPGELWYQNFDFSDFN